MAPNKTDSEVAAPTNCCKRCSKNTLSGSKCVVCGVVTHNGCIKFLKGVKILSDTEIDCCSGGGSYSTTLNSGPKSPNIIVPDDDSKFSEIVYLKELLRHKDTIIDSQADLIKSLKDQIELLTARRVETPSTFPPKQNVNRTRMSYSSVVSPTPVVVGQPASGTQVAAESVTKSVTKPIISENQVTIHDLQQALNGVEVLPTDCIPDVASDVRKKNVTDDNYWTASRSSRRKNKPIIGDRPEDSVCSLKAAEKVTYWHLYYLDPKTTVGEVESYLKQETPGARVEKLQSANPEQYSSFKITVSERYRDKISNPNMWPSGARIIRFFLCRGNRGQRQSVSTDA